MSSSSEHRTLKPVKSSSAGRGFATWSASGIPEIHDTPEQTRRINKTMVTYIEYLSAVASKPQTIDSPTALKELLRPAPAGQNNDPSLQLFIVEDLSRQVIETLGSRFDIDPMFFRDHVDDYVWHNVRDPWAQPPSLLSSMKHRQWFRLRNMRVRYYETQEEFGQAWAATNKWNVHRRPEDDKNRWKFADNEDSVVALMRTRTTVWIGKDKERNNSTVGIVLVDPTTSQGRPLWYDRTNWLPTPSMNDPPKAIGSLSESWYKDIINMTQTYPWFEAPKIKQNNLQVFTKPALYTICAEWLVVCDYTKARLSQIERELEMPRLFRSKGDAIDTSLKRLHTWRRQIPIFKEMVKDTLEHALPTAARLAPLPTATNFTMPISPVSTFSNRSLITDTSVVLQDDLSGYEDITPDLLSLLTTIETLQTRVDRLTDIVTSEINIEDSRRGLKENHNMARLTWLATIFIPFSFISSFYSMNEDIASMKNTYGWFFITAVPFTLVVMAIGWRVGRDSWMPGGDGGHGGIFKGKDVKVKQEPGTEEEEGVWKNSFRKSRNG
ncbi:cora-like Mg2+ transporter protein-domain-containing protein [Phaeosphaeria sp. MPI-PUGE-AT-0046c]|nr:cora-like Mg2+ transporter protein-domain-containing protein [Phaeosphaeria sp. MPI-PUGE-AT-0046c]